MRHATDFFCTWNRDHGYTTLRSRLFLLGLESSKIQIKQYYFYNEWIHARHYLLEENEKLALDNAALILIACIN